MFAATSSSQVQFVHEDIAAVSSIVVAAYCRAVRFSSSIDYHGTSLSRKVARKNNLAVQSDFAEANELREVCSATAYEEDWPWWKI